MYVLWVQCSACVWSCIWPFCYLMNCNPPGFSVHGIFQARIPESESESLSVMSDSLQPHELYSPWNSAGQNTGVGSLSLLQGIFPTQGSNPGLPHCRWILYQLSHKGSPRTLEWLSYPFSSRSSPPRSQARVSCIAGGFFTKWALARQNKIIEKLKKKSDNGICFWSKKKKKPRCFALCKIN